MHTFLALYRGRTVAEARMIVATADEELVAFVADKLLRNPPDTTDPRVLSLERGKQAALRLVRQEARHGSQD
jgi:hypothetical protein